MAAQPRMRLRVAGVGVLAGLLMLGGCVAAAVVPLVGAGASAGQKGYAFWESGTLRYTDEATLEQMSAAVVASGERLALDVSEAEEQFDDSGGVRVRTWDLSASGRRVMEVRLRPLTKAMISVSIEVGTLGNRSVARLFADRLKDELERGREPLPARVP